MSLFSKLFNRKTRTTIQNSNSKTLTKAMIESQRYVNTLDKYKFISVTNDRYRFCLIKHAYGFTNREVAKMLNVSDERARQMLMKARKEIDVQLKENGLVLENA